MGLGAGCYVLHLYCDADDDAAHSDPRLTNATDSCEATGKDFRAALAAARACGWWVSRATRGTDRRAALCPYHAPKVRSAQRGVAER